MASWRGLARFYVREKRQVSEWTEYEEKGQRRTLDYDDFATPNRVRTSLSVTSSAVKGYDPVPFPLFSMATSESTSILLSGATRKKSALLPH